MSEPLVWLPNDVAEFGELPAGLRYETVDPRRGVPESVREALEIHPVSDVREVLEIAIEPAVSRPHNQAAVAA